MNSSTPASSTTMRYFDVFVEYAKGGPEDLLIRISVHNRGAEAAQIQLLPTLWFRNTWASGDRCQSPCCKQTTDGRLHASHPQLGEYTLQCEHAPELLFTENETNCRPPVGTTEYCTLCKGRIPRVRRSWKQEAVNPAHTGTKAAALYSLGCRRANRRLCICA